MASPLSEAHITAQERLRAIVAGMVAAAWNGLPSHNRADVEPFLARTIPVVLAGQRQSVALTEAYLARALERRPLGLSADALIGAAVRSGTPLEEVYRRPFVTAWSLLKDARLEGIATGEYITSADARPRDKDYITQLVKGFKADRTRDGEIASRLVAAVQQTNFPPPDLVLSIPADPGKEDRFAGVRQRVASQLGAKPLVPPIREVSDIPGYRQMTVRQRREAAAKLGGRFRVTDPSVVRGKRILLLDDVVVSGEQARDTIAALKRAGATDVKFAALARARGLPEALEAGLNRAVSTAEMDIQLSSRATYGAVQEADDGIYGFRRVADSGACQFCLSINGAYVKSPSAHALHPHCGCGLEPLTEPHPGAKWLPSGASVHDDFAIHEHGELGSLIGAPGDHFAGPSVVK